MKTLRFLLSLFVLAAISYGQTLHGVQLADMDTSVKACDDFYEYANGSWRKSNPIPASMPRWSRRWEAGEKAKDRLREILEEVSAKGPYKDRTTDQVVSDFYLTCKDEALADKNGVKPILPMLQRIRKAKSKNDIQAAIAELALMGISAPFGIYGGQDNHDPQQVISQIYAGGLGLPDRDYYLKSEDRFVDARAKYKDHVKKMFDLAGIADASSPFDFETELAGASLDNVALRDPAATDHKMKFADM
ncbi:MAG TPA: M13 family metallopeptidase N-terminal domain-containing protein, partial [Pyrinomonadaceae bacterium]|nr:M13 family metallopeptidase N-terminal domain-containing protein [Pyrinomonadaceae bacterium]